MRIGILSDTHGHLDDRILHHLQDCDEIWHAGDIGNISVTDQLAQFKPLRAVHGNIDGGPARMQFPEDLVFTCEGMKVFMTHIAGKPTSYNQRVRDLLKMHRPQILVCGHSHILRVEFDKKNQVLFINPGAAGIHGFHKVRTLVRLTIEKGEIKAADVVELGARAGKKED